MPSNVGLTPMGLTPLSSAFVRDPKLPIDIRKISKLTGREVVLKERVPGSNESIWKLTDWTYLWNKKYPLKPDMQIAFRSPEGDVMVLKAASGLETKKMAFQHYFAPARLAIAAMGSGLLGGVVGAIVAIGTPVLATTAIPVAAASVFGSILVHQAVRTLTSPPPVRLQAFESFSADFT